MTPTEEENRTEVLPEDDPRLQAAMNITRKVQAVLDNETIDAVLNGLGFIIAEFLASKNEDERKVIFDDFVNIIQLNTRRFAGEHTA